MPELTAVPAIAPTFDLDPALAAAHPPLEELVARMRALTGSSDPQARWMASDRWLTCDGGALAGALVARDLGIEARLCVGLYWHTDPQLRAEQMGDSPDPGPAGAAAWTQHLAWVRAVAMDEHHHWVLLWPHTPTPVLLDPNGPCRREPYLQPVTAGVYDDGWDRPGSGRYSELPEGDPWRAAVYDPDDDLDEIADRTYPGLRAAVTGAGA